VAATGGHNEEQSEWSSGVSVDLVQSVGQKFVKGGASQFHKFRVNLHKFHALFSMRLSQLDQAITSFAQDGFRKYL
jgi:hypothetical protein